MPKSEANRFAAENEVSARLVWFARLSLVVPISLIIISIVDGVARDVGIGLGSALIMTCLAKNPWLLRCRIPLGLEEVERVREPELAMAGTAVIVGALMML